MKGDDVLKGRFLWHGPRLWGISTCVGAGIGVGLARLIPGEYLPGGQANVPLWLVGPFVTMLLSIALGPLLGARAWHRHFPDVAFFLGALVAAYYLGGFTRSSPGSSITYGAEKVLHTVSEYYSFIALVGGLYVVSGSILIRLRWRATPVSNTLFLLLGAVLANILGTTGASMLLIRPFLRSNEGRLRPLHVVFFIFLISNCAGCLTPIGDPPLYLGYLKGVPFFWTIASLWEDWLLVVGLLLVMFFIYDRWVERHYACALGEGETRSHIPRLEIRTRPVSVVILVSMVGAVFIDPVLQGMLHLPHLPYGATAQVFLAVLAYKTAHKEILDANEFSFFPVQEVGLLFVGIFLTMIPALGYLAEHGREFGLNSPGTYYFATGALSATLDNAPTYLNFLQIAMGAEEMTRANVLALSQSPGGHVLLMAVSTGAVFFGAMTYIGNGPNFMVRAIAESAEVRMPSFFGYIGWGIALLLPVLIVHWVVMIR